MPRVYGAEHVQGPHHQEGTRAGTGALFRRMAPARRRWQLGAQQGPLCAASLALRLECLGCRRRCTEGGALRLPRALVLLGRAGDGRGAVRRRDLGSGRGRRCCRRYRGRVGHDGGGDAAAWGWVEGEARLSPSSIESTAQAAAAIVPGPDPLAGPLLTRWGRPWLAVWFLRQK